MALLYKGSSPLRGVWKMEETSGELLASLERTADYSPFLERVTSEGRRREYLASRVLLKALLGEEVEVAYRPSGAPFLPALPLHISISHTRGYAAVIVDEHPTGIDIEYYSERVKKIRLRFLSPEEEAFILPQFETEQLLLCWCAKETLYKIAGLEDIDFSCHLHVRPFRFSSPEGFLTVYETKTAQQNRYILRYEVRPEYILTYLAPEAPNFK